MGSDLMPFMLLVQKTGVPRHRGRGWECGWGGGNGGTGPRTGREGQKNEDEKTQEERLSPQSRGRQAGFVAEEEAFP